MPFCKKCGAPIPSVPGLTLCEDCLKSLLPDDENARVLLKVSSPAPAPDVIPESERPTASRVEDSEESHALSKWAKGVSIERLKKRVDLPMITVTAETADALNARLQEMGESMTEEERIEKLFMFPPLFPAFLIRIVTKFSPKPNFIYCEYITPELAYLLYWYEEKKLLAMSNAFSRPSNTPGTPFHMRMNAISAAFCAYPLEKQARTGRMVFQIWASVSRYMLYYSPELEYAERSSSPALSSRKKPAVPPSRTELLLKSKRRFYSIDSSAPTRMRKPPEYHKLSWSRRGHYRRVGKSKTWRYFPPTVVRRKDAGKRKARAAHYKIEN